MKVKILFFVILLGFASLNCWAEVASETIKGAHSFSIVDALNRKIELKSAPEKIIVAGKAGFMITNAAFLFPSASDKLIGYSKTYQMKDLESFFKMVDDRYDEKQLIDHNVGIEQIAAMNPDLVLMKTFESSKFQKGFEQLGIPVAFFDMETPEKFLKEIHVLGEIFGNKKQSTKIVDFYEKWQKIIGEAVSAIPAEKEKLNVLHIFYSDRGGSVSFNVAPDSWIQIKLITMAGGNPVWKNSNPGGGWLVVGFDQIAAWDPDIVLVTSYFGDLVQAKANLADNNFWKLLKAVENKHIYAVPEDFLSWDQPDSRWILGLFWMATKFSPEAAKILNGKFNEIYTEFYHLYGLREDQIAEIKIKGDIF